MEKMLEMQVQSNSGIPDKLNPESNAYYKFKEGILTVMGEEEIKEHGDKNRLYFGDNVSFINLDDLKKANIGLTYKEVDHLTKAKETILGGLKIIRKPHPSTTIEANFSYDEYKIIKAYLKLI